MVSQPSVFQPFLMLLPALGGKIVCGYFINSFVPSRISASFICPCCPLWTSDFCTSHTAPQHLVCRVVQSLHTNHMQMSIVEVFVCRRLHMNTSMIPICIRLICRLCTALHTKCCGAVAIACNCFRVPITIIKATLIPACVHSLGKQIKWDSSQEYPLHIYVILRI